MLLIPTLPGTPTSFAKFAAARGGSLVGRMASQPTLLQRIALEEPGRCIPFIFGFDLPAKSLVFPGGDLGPGVEAGELELMVGSNAEPLAMVRTRTWASG